MIDPKPNVARMVEELKEDAAQRRRRLSAVTSPRGNTDSSSENDITFPSGSDLPRLELESPQVERNQIHYRLQELLAFDDREFVYNAYRAILKRPPDAAGLSNAIDGLRSGRIDKMDILAKLSLSEEGREKGVSIPGLRWRSIVHEMCRWPLFQYLAMPVYSLLRLPSFMRDQQRMAGAILTRQELIANYVNDNLAAQLRSLGLLIKKASHVLEEQRQTQQMITKRIVELSRGSDERFNEEAMRRQQEYKDRTAEIEDLRRVYNKYRTQVELTEKDLKREMQHLFLKNQEVKTELVYQSQRVRSLLEQGVSSEFAEAVSQGVADDSRALDAFFASFDEQFRGDRSEVKQRLRAYLPLLREYGAGSIEAPILDVGCGRGEWLELLKEENLQATGVEVNAVLVNQCHISGLEVTQADLIDHLRRVADGSLGAVSAFHIVEHLPIEKLVSLLDEVVRVLRPGGLILLETPNPENVLVGSCNFYFDLTHRNPLPSPVLRFLVESRGFVVVESFGLNPSDEKPVDGDSELVKRFNRYFYGPMDYAIVARKV